MKILILVQGTFDASYQDIERVSKNTWVSSNTNTDITIKFYYGYYNSDRKPFKNLDFNFKKYNTSEDSFDNIIVNTYDTLGSYFDPRAEKYILSLEHVLKNYHFDFLLRMSNTSYIRLDKLYEYCVDKPRDKFFHGSVNMFDYKYYFISGHNNILSRDCAEKLVQCKKKYLSYTYPEDLASGVLLIHDEKYVCIPKDNYLLPHVFAYHHDFKPENYLNGPEYSFKFRNTNSLQMKESHKVFYKK